MSDWNTQVINEFRANEGKVGGPFKGAPLLLLHTTGAKTGKEHISPLMYLIEDNRMFIFASKSGAPTNPDWYYNLLAHPEATVEVGTESFKVKASEIKGEERDRIYAEQARRYSGFADYQAKTTRKIPVIALERE